MMTTEISHQNKKRWELVIDIFKVFWIKIKMIASR